MKRLVVIALALLVLPARAQDTTRTEAELLALRERGVRAEIRSKTTKRNPKTGRSTIAMVEAYTKGVIADAQGRLVFFLADDHDEAWIRTNSVALLEAADDLIALLEAEGRDVSSLRELNEKWFPHLTGDGDEDAVQVWEDELFAKGVPLVISLFSFTVNGEGDVYPSLGVKNISDRTVTGVTLEVLAFNQFGDVVRDRSTDMATHHATLSGTIRSGDTALFSYTDTALFNNRSTVCMEVRKVLVTFQDGSSATVDYLLKDARMAPEHYHVMGECSRVDSGP